MENVRNCYASENLDRIFRYFMRTVLRMEKSGFLSLPVENDLQGEPVRSYLDLAMNLFIGAQPQQVVRPILESQYSFILNNSQLSADTAMEMWMVRELSLHVHFVPDPTEFLMDTRSLWGDLANEYACLTFYPSLSPDWRQAQGVEEITSHIPPERLRLKDF